MKSVLAHEWAIFIVHMSELSSLYTWVSYLHCTHEWAIFIVHMSELSSLYTWLSYLHCTHEWAIFIVHMRAIFIVHMSELSSLYSYMWFIFDIQNSRVIHIVYYIEITLLLRHFKNELSFHCWTSNDIFEWATVATLTSHSEIKKMFHWVK